MTSINIGDRVCLRYAPFGKAGTVVGFVRGKAKVDWQDLQITTKHALEALQLQQINPVRRQA